MKNILENIDFDIITPEKLPAEKIPHLKFNIQTRDTQEKLVKLLNKRKKLASATENYKTEYIANETEILLVKTDIELAQVHTSIIKKNTYIKEYSESIHSALKETKEKYLESITQLHAIGSEQADNHLKIFDEKLFSENWEYLVNFYIVAKSILNPPVEGKLQSVKG